MLTKNECLIDLAAKTHRNLITYQRIFKRREGDIKFKMFKYEISLQISVKQFYVYWEWRDW
jgi:hypothetical protein